MKPYDSLTYIFVDNDEDGKILFDRVTESIDREKVERNVPHITVGVKVMNVNNDIVMKNAYQITHTPTIILLDRHVKEVKRYLVDDETGKEIKE